ncbi:MAG TPA: hypothetical protein VFI08_08050, partial [Spirochaetia bacterium]|nr:hypothetical protein [Spirochaetia bacterium]
MTEMLDNSSLPWDRLLDLLSSLESCQSPEQFYGALAAGLAPLVPFDVAAVFCRGMNRLLFAAGGTPSRLRYATAHHLSVMPFLADPASRPAALRTVDGSHSRTRAGSPHVVRMAVGGGPTGSNRFVALHRFGRSRGFSARETKILKVLSPHVCNLAALIDRLPERAEPEPTGDELDRAIRALTRRERQVASLLC